MLNGEQYEKCKKYKQMINDYLAEDNCNKEWEILLIDVQKLLNKEIQSIEHINKPFEGD